MDTRNFVLNSILKSTQTGFPINVLSLMMPNSYDTTRAKLEKQPNTRTVYVFPPSPTSFDFLLNTAWIDAFN